MRIFFKKGSLTADQLKESKKNLLLKEFKGSFFKKMSRSQTKINVLQLFCIKSWTEL